MNNHSIRQPTTAGFTLIELLIAIGLIVLLAGMVFPVIRMLMENSRRARADERVAALHTALIAYAAEDERRRFPTAEGDMVLRSSGSVLLPRALDLLVPAYFNSGLQTLADDLDQPGTRALRDPWGRAYRYSVDASVDGNTARPDPARLDWNGRDKEPYAYVWSLGRPLLGSATSPAATDPDVLQPNPAWIYIVTTAQGQP